MHSPKPRDVHISDLKLAVQNQLDEIAALKASIHAIELQYKDQLCAARRNSEDAVEAVRHQMRQQSLSFDAERASWILKLNSVQKEIELQSASASRQIAVIKNEHEAQLQSYRQDFDAKILELNHAIAEQAAEIQSLGASNESYKSQLEQLNRLNKDLENKQRQLQWKATDDNRMAAARIAELEQVIKLGDEHACEQETKFQEALQQVQTCSQLQLSILTTERDKAVAKTLETEHTLQKALKSTIARLQQQLQNTNQPHVAPELEQENAELKMIVHEMRKEMEALNQEVEAVLQQRDRLQQHSMDLHPTLPSSGYSAAIATAYGEANNDSAPVAEYAKSQYNQGYVQMLRDTLAQKEATIQQLQSKLNQQQSYDQPQGQTVSEWSQLISENGQLREKLQMAISDMRRLVRDKAQLVDMSNTLRAELRVWEHKSMNLKESSTQSCVVIRF
eukprot:jgi/Hompol1/4725/HPOL_001825-RA